LDEKKLIKKFIFYCFFQKKCKYLIISVKKFEKIYTIDYQWITQKYLVLI